MPNMPLVLKPRITYESANCITLMFRWNHSLWAQQWTSLVLSAKHYLLVFIICAFIFFKSCCDFSFLNLNASCFLESLFLILIPLLNFFLRKIWLKGKLFPKIKIGICFLTLTSLKWHANHLGCERSCEKLLRDFSSHSLLTCATQPTPIWEQVSQMFFSVPQRINDYGFDWKE
jgi:hypothetical protein